MTQPASDSDQARAVVADLRAHLTPQEQPLLSPIAAALYEQNAAPRSWPDAHPHDVICYTNDAYIALVAIRSATGHASAAARLAEAQATDYDRDPEAIAWARRKIQDEIDRCRKFHTSALEAGKPEQAEMWNRLANRMQRTFMGGSGCVHAYFDERLPALRRAADTVEDER
jgi:hypothetical protein